MVGGLRDVITCAEFQIEIFMGYDFTGGRIFDFSIDFSMGLTTVQRYCAACDRNLEMWVRGHSRSLKVVLFESFDTVSYSPFTVTMAVSAAISQIFSVKEWPDLEIWVWGPSRS